MNDEVNPADLPLLLRGSVQPGDYLTSNVANRLLYAAADYIGSKLADEARTHDAASPAAQAVDLWQPIETAPKDGTIIIVAGAPELGYTLPCIVDALYDDGGWLVNQWESPSFAITPTHWMPIPPLDQQAGNGGA